MAGLVRNVFSNWRNVALLTVLCAYAASATCKEPKKVGPVTGVGATTGVTAPVFSDWGYITHSSTAWNEDALAVYHQPLGAASEVVIGQIIPCPIPHDPYATDPTVSGRKLQHAAIIGAYLHHKQVQFLVKGCAYGKPRISTDIILACRASNYASIARYSCVRPR